MAQGHISLSGIDVILQINWLDK
jgi:hypothetical protein